MIRHLLKPFSYLSIRHPHKARVDWLYPLVLSFISVMVLFVLKQYGDIPLYQADGLISKMLGFVQSLPGFYIAALAAIAIFDKVDIDRPMPAPTPKVMIQILGKTVAVDLTRRRFLCSMFAFLTAESLFIILVAMMSQTFYLPIKNILPDRWETGISFCFMWLFLLVFWQMLVTSFWGLFYLGEKLHLPDQ